MMGTWDDGRMESFYGFFSIPSFTIPLFRLKCGKLNFGKSPKMVEGARRLFLKEGVECFARVLRGRA